MSKMKLAFFSIPEYEKEQKWLQKQHASGLKLIHFTPPFFYHFDECEPQNMVYQLDYNEEGLAHKEEYIQLFKDCGWEYIEDVGGYSYFRKPVSEMDQGIEEIFCDDNSRMDMIKRVFKGRMIPLLVLFFLCIVPQLWIQFHLDFPFAKILFWLLGIVFLMYIVIFVQFTITYIRLKKRLDS